MAETEDPARKAKAECLRLLAVKPRSRADLAAALARKGYDNDVSEPVLDRLERANLVNDAEYAESLVRSRHTHQGLGRRALRMELRRRGVDGELAEEVLGAIEPEDEAARAHELVRKRLRSMTEVDDTTATRRLVGLLARKGYGEGLAYRVVREELEAADRTTAVLEQTDVSI